jgi:hypothetical protein
MSLEKFRSFGVRRFVEHFSAHERWLKGQFSLLLDSHSTHVTGRVAAFAASERILIIRLVLHSSHLSLPLDVYTFGLFKIVYLKEHKTQKLKGET